MVKKSLTPKRKIFEKIDRAFHTLFFSKGFDETSLEVLVEENIESKNHNFSVRGNYLKEKKSSAFRTVPDRIYWAPNLPLAEDYAKAIALTLDSRVYTAGSEGTRVSIKAKISLGEIKKAVSSYVEGFGGYLTEKQFMDLTGASIAQLARLWGQDYDVLANRHYSAHDILRFSRRCYKELTVQRVHTKDIYETKEHHSANIMTIYRKILDRSSPNQMQGTLF